MSPLRITGGFPITFFINAFFNQQKLGRGQLRSHGRFEIQRGIKTGDQEFIRPQFAHQHAARRSGLIDCRSRGGWGGGTSGRRTETDKNIVAVEIEHAAGYSDLLDGGLQLSGGL